MGYLSLEFQEQLNTLMLPCLALITLAFAVCVDPYVSKPTRRTMLVIDAIVLALIADNSISNLMEAAWDPAYITLETALAVFGYIMRPVVIVLFIYILWDDPKRRLFWVLIGVNIIVYLTAFFGQWTFYITEDGSFIRGPLGYTAHFISFVLLLAQQIAAVFYCVFYYIWLHLHFVHEHERALLAEQRIQIMISQIQPHFLYNTLTTIQSLCLENPRKAAVITERFATYLRQNIDSLNKAVLIPFRKELDHTLVYAQIEMERFPNIHVDYEIEDEDFFLPALTVQPLVENSIRHGTRGIPRGQIEIITNLLPDCHEIIIRDNGKGFSPDEVPEEEGSHIGIRNVQERLQKLCAGTMNIESEKGRGTCITIHIPRGKE